MGLLRFMLGLMGLANTQSDNDMIREQDDYQFDEMLRQQRENEWEHATKPEDDCD